MPNWANSSRESVHDWRCWRQRGTFSSFAVLQVDPQYFAFKATPLNLQSAILIYRNFATLRRRLQRPAGSRPGIIDLAGAWQRGYQRAFGESTKQQPCAAASGEPPSQTSARHLDTILCHHHPPLRQLLSPAVANLDHCHRLWLRGASFC